MHLDSGGDIAGLELTRDAPRDCQLGSYDSEVRGHRFKVYGVPEGHPNGVWAFGVFGPRLPVNNWVQIEDDKIPGQRVRPGFSGGPAWSEDCQCITGMVVAADTDPTAKTAFVVPIEAILTAWPTLRDHHVQTQPPRQKSVASPPAGSRTASPSPKDAPALLSLPEDLILAAAVAIEREVVEDTIKKVEGSNSTETLKMQKLLRTALSEGGTGDIRETAALLGRAMNQFLTHFTSRIESIKDKVSLLNKSIKRSLNILHKPPFSPASPSEEENHGGQ